MRLKQALQHVQRFDLAHTARLESKTISRLQRSRLISFAVQSICHHGRGMECKARKQAANAELTH